MYFSIQGKMCCSFIREYLQIALHSRSPQFRVVSLKSLRSGGQVPLKFIRNDPNDPLNFTLTFDLTMNVSFYNDNRYTFAVDELYMSVSYLHLDLPLLLQRHF